VRLFVLGSGVLEPTRRRGASAYALEAGEDLLLLEMGPGALRSALLCGLDPRRARHVFLSHFHPDHTADLVAFLFACNCSEAWRPVDSLHFHGPSGLGRFLEDLEIPFRWLRPRGWQRRIHEDDGSWFQGREWRARAFPVRHGSDPALAWRFESAGRVLCYSGDSAECEGLAEAAAGADLLLCECTGDGDSPPLEGHLGPEEVGRLATLAGAARVVLTHLAPTTERTDLPGQVQRICSCPVERAEDGMVWDLSADSEPGGLSLRATEG
jgi:ribonuclease BN (tRNA processing enzyme)